MSSLDQEIEAILRSTRPDYGESVKLENITHLANAAADLKALTLRHTEQAVREALEYCYDALEFKHLTAETRKRSIDEDMAALRTKPSPHQRRAANEESCNNH